MPTTYTNPVYPYLRSVDQDAGAAAHHPVIIVGAGLVGLTVAVDLATRGIASVVLDDNDTVSYGSRAICFSKRTLEIYDRLGIGDKLRAKGITWNLGKVFLKDRQLFEFNLLPEGGEENPAFVNLQQYYVEEWLVERAKETGLVDLRWKNKVAGVTPGADKVGLQVETPDGPYDLTCDYLLACDGARSFVREALGLEFKGQVFQDRFLITDVLMKADFPTERWFWFDPPFHPDQSALLHRQADDVWRIDLQLGWDADPEAESQPERVVPRLKAMLGEDKDFELEWISVYTFQCRRLDRFRHDRVYFLGDSAHQVSPFGARGGNGGVQDSDNLVWKLEAVLRGAAPEALLESYDAERIPAADENILNSTRATDFITPKSAVSRAFRDAVLELAETCPFARSLVNSGRLSLPHDAVDSPLATPDSEDFGGRVRPGGPAADAPVESAEGPGWLLRQIGPGFTLLYFAGDGEPEGLEALDGEGIRVLLLACEARNDRDPAHLVDREGLAAQRYDARPGTWYLFRPDQHLAARGRRFERTAVLAARDRALCQIHAAAGDTAQGVA